MSVHPRLKDRPHPDLESIQAILKQIEGALAVRRQKADHSRRAEYEAEDLDIRRYICRHVLDYHDQMDDALVEFWLECHFHSGQPSGHSPSGLHSLGSSQISLPENVPGDCCGADQGRVGFGGILYDR